MRPRRVVMVGILWVLFVAVLVGVSGPPPSAADSGMQSYKSRALSGPRGPIQLPPAPRLPAGGETALTSVLALLVLVVTIALFAPGGAAGGDHEAVV